MNITTGRALPSRATWAGLQFVWLAAGLALAVSAAIIIGRAADDSAAKPASSSIASTADVRHLTVPEERTVYIVSTAEEAAALYSAANEGLGRPATVIIAASPEDEAYVPLMAAESAHGVLQGVQIIDLRDR
jgi:hypothetical protein